MARPIDREPRGTREYEEKLARLDGERRLIVELAEESIEFIDFALFDPD